jgi:hypothetical protein
VSAGRTTSAPREIVMVTFRRDVTYGATAYDFFVDRLKLSRVKGGSRGKSFEVAAAPRRVAER